MTSHDLSVQYSIGRLAVEAAMEDQYRPRSRMLRLAMRAMTFAAGPYTALDLETMPDRLKRDLGFMDGRDPHYGGG